jgi:hypothetical protein
VPDKIGGKLAQVPKDGVKHPGSQQSSAERKSLFCDNSGLEKEEHDPNEAEPGNELHNRDWA